MRSVTILGGGLAGVLLADSLHRQGAERVLVLDGRDPRRASDAIRAMMHPFPGRSMKPVEDLFLAVRASAQRLIEWGKDAPGCVFSAPMVRPLLGGKTAKRLQKSYEKFWEGKTGGDATVERWSWEEVEEKFPFFKPSEGAIVYEPNFSIDLAGVLRGVRARLEASGVDFCPQKARSCVRKDGVWLISLEDGTVLRTRDLILAPGSALASLFPSLPGQVECGELMRLRPDFSAEQMCLVSASGSYLAPCEDRSWVVGATRLPPEAWETRRPEEAEEDLRERAARFSLKIGEGERREIWRGVRFTFVGDRLPLAGPVPGFEGLFVLGALGSKGLLWGPWAAECLVAHLLQGKEIPGSVSSLRAGEGAWEPGGVLFS